LNQTGNTKGYIEPESKEKRAFRRAAEEVRMLETLLRSAKEREQRAAEAAGY
jgi:hypothetical protein